MSFKIFFKIVKKFSMIARYKKICTIVHWDTAINDSVIEERVLISKGASLNNSTIGRYTSVGRGSKINYSDIGSFCSISWDSTIGATSHPVNRITTHAFPYVPYAGQFVAERTQEIKKTRIGNDVWIGANSVILPGVNISDGAVIGAGSVVTKDVPPYGIVAGVPAQLIRYRFEEATIKQLLRLQWWKWPREKIQKNIALFQEDLTPQVLEKLKT